VLPLPRLARVSAIVASLAIALVGVVASAVRLLPWLLDPSVPWRVAAPFARGLAAVALEAALLVGWPVGWALACVRFVESGEARVLVSLGESPLATVRRLAPHGALLALALGAVSLVYGGDATAPGQVATELVAQAGVSCAQATQPVTYAIPFTEMTWLCAPDRAPRIVGRAPGGLAGAVLSARSARIAGDFRAIELQDAHVLMPAAASAAGGVELSVGVLSLHGMAPWASASTLPPWLRALLLAASAWLTASVSAFVVLLRATARRAGRLGALAIGASGPLAALGLLRILERADAPARAFVLLPLAAAAACLVMSALLSRLRWPWRTAST
jgi:hypothetical protein